MELFYSCQTFWPYPLKTFPPKTAKYIQEQFVEIPDGIFRMGSLEGEKDAQPYKRHLRSFYISRHEVTVEEYVFFLNAIKATNLMNHTQLISQSGTIRPRKGTHKKPITHVHYNDAIHYCDWLSKEKNVLIRLPTEPEWEVAARGGIHGSRYPWGWGFPHKKRECFDEKGPKSVGMYKPNPYGIYDMAGNVFEWCLIQKKSIQTKKRVARGGSWAEKSPKLLRVFHRTWFPTGYRGQDVGFRIVIENDTTTLAMLTF
ncbi:MAG: SUMF1/EgtB/PvdO family nonheme iron enzyme [Kiritimatiellae bacterium]|nr:SUMF1/EgtB/PvdO family nonheme iron enzyme [Kiritimatiellia bacterium]